MEDVKNDSKKFAHFISLGHACHLASSMSAYGLRGWSGPFDWLVTKEFEWILHYIENDFEDFLLFSNLQQRSENTFIEKNSGFEFLHDADMLPWKRYEELYQRYHKKTERFLSAEKEPCCFLRSVLNVNEIIFIKDNKTKIQSIIQKYNKKSQIVFLIPKRLEKEIGEGFPFRYFILKNSTSIERSALRGWFNGEKDFLEYCAKRYDGVKLINNLLFDQAKERKETEKQETLEARYRLLVDLLEHDFERMALPEKVIIYGAGIVGKQLYEKIKKYSSVTCFIDRKWKGTLIDFVPCVGIEDVEFNQESQVIITMASGYEHIVEMLKEKYPLTKVILLKDLINSPF